VGEVLEWAVGAFWFWFAEVFADLHQQCVVFIEELGILLEIRLEQVLQLCIAGVRLDQVVADSDAGGVGIDYEDGSAECVEQDGVGGFRAYALYAQKLLPQLIGVDGFEILKSAVVVLEEPTQEAHNAFCLHVEIAGRADEFGQPGVVEIVKRLWR